MADVSERCCGRVKADGWGELHTVWINKRVFLYLSKVSGVDMRIQSLWNGI
jgi:hypothetical protein